MRFPNGYGSVYKLHGNRRRPWAVRITVGRDHATLKYKYLGYYETKEKALIALADYNSSPYDLDLNKVTFAEIFDLWSKEHYPQISKSNALGYDAAYKSCKPLHNLKFVNIKRIQMQHLIDSCGKNYPSLVKIKVLFSALFKYAIQNDVVDKDYSKYVSVSQYADRNPNAVERKPFILEEIDMLWNHQDDKVVSTVLMLIYSGVRISELLDLKKENVNLSEKWFDVVASKTKSGIRRVPIADKVLPLFQTWNDSNDSEYLLSGPAGQKIPYMTYHHHMWAGMLERLHMDHRPHDARHTCISLLTAANVSDKVIKKIVGHKAQSITENVYTHFDFQVLLDAINRI